ncbi:hypothetical protein [Glutamicibacter sp. NPDC087344]|uniref:hypothetical protein n=1 Tax=Glutamicibacter sp. NPDC087344 TaxID=3363994 RepID=UPI00380DAD0C
MAEVNQIGVRWNARKQCAELLLDGRSLAQFVDPAGDWCVSPFARRFLRGELRKLLPTYRADFAGRDHRMSGREIEIYVCRSCGDLGCGNLAVDLELGPQWVRWSRPHWAADDDPEEYDEFEQLIPGDPLELMPQELVFARAEYDRALARIHTYLSRPGWQRNPEGSGVERFIARVGRHRWQ